MIPRKILDRCSPKYAQHIMLFCYRSCSNCWRACYTPHSPKVMRHHHDTVAPSSSPSSSPTSSPSSSPSWNRGTFLLQLPDDTLLTLLFTQNRFHSSALLLSFFTLKSRINILHLFACWVPSCSSIELIY